MLQTIQYYRHTQKSLPVLDMFCDMHRSLSDTTDSKYSPTSSSENTQIKVQKWKRHCELIRGRLRTAASSSTCISTTHKEYLCATDTRRSRKPPGFDKTKFNEAYRMHIFGVMIKSGAI